MNKLNIKIGNKTYIQRHEFSKLIVFDNEIKKVYNEFCDLPQEEQKLIKDAIKIQNNPENYFKFDDTNKSNSITIIKYIGDDVENVVIPPVINGLPVSIKGNVFYNNKNIKSIYLPENISEIDNDFCTDVQSLEKVYLSPNITNIPNNCFFRCMSLKEINTEKITIIDDGGFHSCESLKEINLENVEYIGYAGFSWCKSLQSVYIPKIEQLGDYAFNHCENLQEAFLGDNLSIIGEATFALCKNLKNIKLPSKLERINREVFVCCENLKTITFPESLNFIGACAFKKSGLSNTITFPPSLEKIQTWAFDNTNIKSINISKNTEYEQNAFPLDALLNINEYDSIITKLKNFFENKER